MTPVLVSEYDRRSRPVDALQRNERGEGDRTVTLRARTEGGSEETLSVNVKERLYTEDELADFSERLDDVLWTVILGNNTDAGNVVDDLDFKKSIDGYPFDISWKSDRPLILSASGRIDKKRLLAEDPGNEGVSIRLCATLKYGDHREDKYAYVILHSDDAQENDKLANSIEGAIKESDEMSSTDSEMVLPDHVKDGKVRFYDNGINRGWVVLLLGVVISVLYIAICDEKIKKTALDRKKQMELDYPNILNQYVLYYLAGMSPRTIWYKMCDSYIRGVQSKEEKRCLFEEMVITRNKMDEGMGELAAYDDFAKRCDSIRVRSFVSFIKQAVVKGNDGLAGLLYEETERARQERINLVKREASEASTKMLFPMLLMLLVVITIVMIPAFIGLGG